MKERQELCTLDLPTNLVLCQILMSDLAKKMGVRAVSEAKTKRG